MALDLDPATNPTLDLDEARQAIGIGRSAAYEAVRAGTWPTPVIRVGRRIRVPTASLRRVLELDPPVAS